PMAIMVSTGKSAELGLLFKNAESLENLHKVDTILLDKTGTITEGKPVVTDIVTDMDQDEFLQIAASIEHLSEHPLSDAIIAFANEKSIENLDVNDFESLTGRGIRAKIDNSVYFAGNLRLINEKNINIGKYQSLTESLSKDRKSTRLNSSHVSISYAVFCW